MPRSLLQYSERGCGFLRLKIWQKNSLSASIIAVGGIALYFLMFLLLALTTQLGNALVRVISGEDNIAINMTLWRYAFFLILLVASWLIFRSKLSDLIKATFMNAPLMVLYVMIGILLYERTQWIVLGIGAVIALVIILFLYIKKLSWMYFFATLFTTGVAAYIVLAGVEI